MIQLILHAAGDYLFQNDWMAQNKVKFTLVGWIACFIHSVIYALPFLLIASPLAFLVIWGMHFLIDKFRLSVYWIKMVNWNWESKNFGYSEDKPLWMSVWLMIIVDNILHIFINYLSIKYL